MPPPPPRREARHELKTPAAFRTPPGTVQLWHLRAAAIGHLHPDKAVPRADRDRDRPARSARPAMPDTIAEQLAHQQGGVIPARVPGTEHPDCERAGDPRPLRPPGHRHALPDLRPSHQRTRLPRPPRPRQITGAGRPGLRECTLDSAAYAKPEHAAGAARPWLSVESRRCPPTVLAAGRRPLCVRGHRDTGVHSDTR